MKITTIERERELIAFVEKAAESFGSNERFATYGDVSPGSLFAVRWGLGDDCVLVLRISEEIPVVYGQVIKNNT